MSPVLPTITFTSGQRDAVYSLALDYLSGIGMSGPVDRVGSIFSADLRQILVDLGETGSGPVELTIERPDDFRRVFREMRRLAAGLGKDPRRQLAMEACECALAAVNGLPAEFEIHMKGKGESRNGLFQKLKARRADKVFQARLKRRLAEDRAVLDRLERHGD